MTDPDSGDQPTGKPGGRNSAKTRRQGRSAARLAAVQALYQMEIAGTDWRTVWREFDAHRLGAEIDGVQYHEADPKMLRTLLEGVVGAQAEIDQMTDRALAEKWPLGRIDATLRAVMRAAGCELLNHADTPVKVVIGEYVDVARAFFDDGREIGFVNAVLDHMAREARPGSLPPKPGSATPKPE